VPVADIFLVEDHPLGVRLPLLAGRQGLRGGRPRSGPAACPAHVGSGAGGVDVDIPELLPLRIINRKA
jgi:hypothetical protein